MRAVVDTNVVACLLLATEGFVEESRGFMGALVRGVRAGIAVYDALFVELAVCETAPLATFDRGILTVFSGVARRPGALMER